MSDQTPATPKKKETVIVAEDSDPNRQILVLLLRKLGYNVIECRDGDIAWKALNENRGTGVVAILADLMMPNMDGMELLRRTRNDAQFAELPFVLITAVSDKDYIFEAKNLKVNGYILKPVTFKRVCSKMQELFPHIVFPHVAS